LTVASGDARLFTVERWELWDGSLSPDHERLASTLNSVLEDMNREADPVIYTWYEHAQWKWKRWEYASVLATLPAAPAGLRVLDAGCGYTPLIRHVASLGTDAYGFDWDLNAAESNLSISSSLLFGDRVSYRQQDIRAMSWPSDYFDVTLSVSVLEHLYQAEGFPAKVWDRLAGSHKPFHYRNVARAIQDLVRVTKPGGLIAITMDCGYGGGIPPSEVERLFDIKFPSFPNVDTIREYWRHDDYYMRRNKIYPNTPREYTGFFAVLRKLVPSAAL